MAANDYYNSSYPQADHYSRADAPLPPAPGNHSTASISPVTSPFDDRNRYDYPPAHSNTSSQLPLTGGYSDTAYHGHDTSHSSDPFADQHAIPLTHQGEMDPKLKRYESDPEARYPPGHEKKQKQKGWLSGRVTWVVFIFTTVQICVFIAELIKMGRLTGSPIQTKPTFNYLIGPSMWLTISMGARYQPCMHNIKVISEANLTNVNWWPCPNNTMSNSADMTCTLSEACGMGGVPDQTQDLSKTGQQRFEDRSIEPNQWWRFITPIFLHAGLVHIGFNMLLQLTLGRDMEKEIGSIRFLLVYISAGIFGNVLGANYSNQAQASTGASGALFGVLALVLLDLLYNWNTRRSPVTDLLFLLLDIGISFILGLLPGLDNFAHIGGFLMGLVLGVSILHSPQALRQRIGLAEPPYSTVASNSPAMNQFLQKPLGFFKGRKPLWWAWWLVRMVTTIVAFVGFILLLRNFYEWRRECSWCHRLSCLPVKDWCNTTSFTFETVPDKNSTVSKRFLDDLMMPVDLTAYL